MSNRSFLDNSFNIGSEIQLKSAVTRMKGFGAKL